MKNKVKKKAILIVNPISGGVDKTDIKAAVETYAKDLGFDLIVYETTGENDDDAIRKLFKTHKPERFIVAGGDGTIKFVAETLEGKDIIIGLLPAGSANGLSVDLNFPPTLEEHLEIAFGNHFMDIDMICINNIKSLHLSDIGLNAELIMNYENGTIRGKLGYAIQAVNTLTSSEAPFHAKIKANGKTIETEAKMIVMANSQKYGTGVTINPMGKMDDGKFEIVIIKNLDLSVFGKIVAGNMPLDTGDVEIISTDKATITTDVPVHFQVDGEYCGEETKLDIKMLKREMKLAVPNL
jgi:diacylglycerol kinase (ATP)